MAVRDRRRQAADRYRVRGDDHEGIGAARPGGFNERKRRRSLMYGCDTAPVLLMETGSWPGSGVVPEDESGADRSARPLKTGGGWGVRRASSIMVPRPGAPRRHRPRGLRRWSNDAAPAPDRPPFPRSRAGHGHGRCTGGDARGFRSLPERPSLRICLSKAARPPASRTGPSDHAGIAVKCRQNLRQAFPESPSNAAGPCRWRYPEPLIYCDHT